PERYRWDDVAEVPYLGLAKNPAKPTEGAAFISFDDERSLRLKIEYARRMKLGGAIIWELGSGWRPELPAGKRDPLLQAVKKAASVKRE
ncbi:MAG TPA: glycosyl hydrolase family 18 protein, partial [Rariglobus sp.]|nr:glycosyl hydrolase family 18 protein [Rariglobus sp.]